MTAAPAPFYRSRMVHYWFIASGAFLTVYLSPWSPHEWHNTPSLRWLHHAMPLTVMSAIFLIYTVLLVIDWLPGVIVADFLGAAMYLCETVALLWTIDLAQWNGWLLVAFGSCVIFHIASGRLAVYVHEST